MDPKFKEQFEIAHPTERYVELLNALPAFFVGREDRLVSLVELLCSEMSAAFQTTGAAAAHSSSCFQVRRRVGKALLLLKSTHAWRVMHSSSVHTWLAAGKIVLC